MPEPLTLSPKPYTSNPNPWWEAVKCAGLDQETEIVFGKPYTLNPVS